ncbi:hypothetical protein JSE7799_02220 [Jannaschia seosinensis]|uniref:Uncharacterized protein n=1 Tax=Jannaschia seosinensis TaxID=313367 RepID=A0A0M7BC59_9RHOB|nr:hypothetical protein JSE7799_02220 [Jannaschia seosinensis]
MDGRCSHTMRLYYPLPLELRLRYHRYTMYTRIAKTGGRQYLQLVEAYRNDRGQSRVRVVANLGRLDKLTPSTLDPLINGLNRG